MSNQINSQPNNKSVQVFKFGNNDSQIQVRLLVDKQSNPWFVAQDVAVALGYTDFDQAVRKNCRKQKELKNIPVSQTGISKKPKDNLLVIPESDVFRLILRSKLESAEKFQDWVVEDVLPAIRKQGYFVAYEVPSHQEPSMYGYKNTEQLSKELGMSAIGLNDYLEYTGWQTPEIDAKHRLYFKPTKEGKKRGILKASLKINGDTRPGEIYWNQKACDEIRGRLSNKIVK
jgi:prophage antirepressor-like protein